MSRRNFGTYSDFRSDIMTIKERVQKLVKTQGTTSQKIEHDLGFASGYISKLDKTNPTSDKLLALADYLDVSVDYILGHDLENNQPDDNAHLIALIRNDEKLLNALQKYFEMPAEKKEHIIDMINYMGK